MEIMTEMSLSESFSVKWDLNGVLGCGGAASQPRCVRLALLASGHTLFRSPITRRGDKRGQRPAILEIPEAHFAIVTAARQASGLSVNRQRINPVLMTREGASQLLFVERMLPDFLVRGTTEDGFLQDDQSENVVVESPDFTGRFTFLRVPEVDSLVAARGADPLVVVAERHGQHGALMSGVTGFQIAVGCGIDARRAVATGGGQMRPIPAPGNGHYPVGVVLHDQLLFAGRHVIDANRIVRAADRQSRTVRAET